MMLISELQEWLDRVTALGGSEIWIDEGGLTLETDNEASYEVGGEPDEDEDDVCIPYGGDEGGTLKD